MPRLPAAGAVPLGPATDVRLIWFEPHAGFRRQVHRGGAAAEGGDGGQKEKGEFHFVSPSIRRVSAEEPLKLEEHAHNGLASARQDGRVPRPLEPCLRGLWP